MREPGYFSGEMLDFGVLDIQPHGRNVI